ncbi:AtpZ/AtpI family protein [Kaistella palustris]|uniref:AtpZ/AtpI family protein n=1 Tax=Kaistella palustris TaxID=493376 RepID=UPI000402F8EA|nr:AtpZ/AtpI family protein [Kaistella palustris]
MAEESSPKQDFSPEDKKKFQKNGLRQYGVYSAVVFQMLATMGLAFWGGNWLNEYFAFHGKILIVAVGFLGMGLAFYNLLHQLKNIQKNEDKN